MQAFFSHIFLAYFVLLKVFLIVTSICHQPDNSDLYKGHELAFPGGGGLMN